MGGDMSCRGLLTAAGLVHVEPADWPVRSCANGGKLTMPVPAAALVGVRFTQTRLDAASFDAAVAGLDGVCDGTHADGACPDVRCLAVAASVTLVDLDGVRYLIDGHHRLAAALSCGLGRLAVWVHDGGPDARQRVALTVPQLRR